MAELFPRGFRITSNRAVNDEIGRARKREKAFRALSGLLTSALTSPEALSFSLMGSEDQLGNLSSLAPEEQALFLQSIMNARARTADERTAQSAGQILRDALAKSGFPELGSLRGEGLSSALSSLLQSGLPGGLLALRESERQREEQQQAARGAVEFLRRALGLPSTPTPQGAEAVGMLDALKTILSAEKPDATADVISAITKNVIFKDAEEALDFMQKILPLFAQKQFFHPAPTEGGSSERQKAINILTGGKAGEKKESIQLTPEEKELLNEIRQYMKERGK